MNISCPVLYSFTSPKGRFFILHCWMEKEREKLNDTWINRKKIWIAPRLWGEIVLFFHVLISPFALLKRWHLEVSSAESAVNCFSEWSFKRSIFHTINLSNYHTDAAWTGADKQDSSCSNKRVQKWQKTWETVVPTRQRTWHLLILCISVANTIYTSRGNHSDSDTLD